MLDTGSVVAVANLTPEHSTVAIQEVWSGPEQAWARYQEYHAAVRDRVARQRHLEKHEIGRANRELEEARLAIRQEELNLNVFVLSTASEIKALNLELHGLDNTREETDILVHALARRLGADSPMTRVGREIGRLLNADIDRRKQVPEKRKRELETEVAAAPPAARRAVSEFLQAHEGAEQKSARIQAEIDQLREEIADYQLRFVTTHLEPLGEITDNIAAALDRGTVPDPLRDTAQLSGITLADDLQIRGSSQEHRWDITGPKQELQESLIVRHEQGKFVLCKPQIFTLGLGEMVLAYPANQLSFWDKLKVYGSRWSEFLMDDPREANSEGGVLPAIWGTVAMTLIMSLVVVPFRRAGCVVSARVRQAGFMVSAVRIAINNLAGVPSIVFGVFGLGFFCYVVGAYIDGGPENAGISPAQSGSWLTLLLATALVAVLAFAGTLFSLTGRHGARSARQASGLVTRPRCCGWRPPACPCTWS